MSRTYERKDCRLCGSKNLKRVIDLAPTPPGNQFLTRDELQSEDELYDLFVMHCKDCTHLQLGMVIDPEILFQRDYKYVSGTSPVFVQHFKGYCDWSIDRFDIPTDGLIIDVGSNDGTGLRCYKDKGYEVLGIDPATEIAAEATKQGIPTWDEFFSIEIAEKVREKFGRADFITSHNACAHIDDLESVMKGVEHLLKDDGVFVFEVGYAMEVYRNAYFDTIYHEHVDFHTVKPLVIFFERLNMVVIDVIQVNVQGGSIRVAVKKKNSKSLSEVTQNVQDCIDLEMTTGFDDPQTFRDFSERIRLVGEELRNTLRDISSLGKRVAAYGAPTKSTTLLTHFGIGKEEIDYIVDDNPKKQGLFSPVKHIPIVSKEKLAENPPDYLLILAWNFADSIMEKNTKFAENGGKFILPMPEVKIV